MAIRRYGGKKQALEGTLNVKKRLAIKTDSVQFIVWGKLKAGWAGQSRVSLDSCSLQLHCTHVVDSKYSANGAVRREGWEERTERCLKTHEWRTGESSLSLIINHQRVISSVSVVLLLFFLNDAKTSSGTA